jgi:hypothetical protein
VHSLLKLRAERARESCALQQQLLRGGGGACDVHVHGGGRQRQRRMEYG